MKPHAPVLGIRDCDLSQSGERQVQIMGGTFVYTNLRRPSVPGPGQEWEQWVPAIGTTPGLWAPYNGRVPTNNLPSLTKEALAHLDAKQDRQQPFRIEDWQD